MNNRKAATDFIINDLLKGIAPDSTFIPEYEQQLNALTDEEFERLMTEIENEKTFINLVVPNGKSDQINVERNIALAKKLFNHDFFQPLVLTDPDTGVVFQTLYPHLTMDVPLRRQVQLLIKKQSIPENNQHVDQLTDQPTGVSKGAKISFPELQMLGAQGADASLNELVNVRGGDRRAYNLMSRLIVAEGSASQKTISSLNSRVRATAVLSAFLKAMHLYNNL